MKFNKSIVVGVDASRNRSGGAQAHLIGILSEINPSDYGISCIHLWSFRTLLDKLPNYPWLIKHDSNPNNTSLLGELWWQATKLPSELKKYGCDILFATDASTLCRFKPMIVLSQDLLSYQPEVMKGFGYGLARLRLLVILYLQNRSFRNSAGSIFLTRFAANQIQKSCGQLSSFVCIPHGVDDTYKKNYNLTPWPFNNERPIRCIYVSNAEMYKHQWSVIYAIALLRSKGYNLNISFVGGGTGRAQFLFDDAVDKVDPERKFVNQVEFIPKHELVSMLIDSDVFIFASSCEAFGITLLEGMSLGLPIACSDKSSLPETLRDGGLYFDPSDHYSIAEAIQKIIDSNDNRTFISKQAKLISHQYSWQKCSHETWSYIVSTYQGVIENEQKFL